MLVCWLMLHFFKEFVIELKSARKKKATLTIAPVDDSLAPDRANLGNRAVAKSKQPSRDLFLSAAKVGKEGEKFAWWTDIEAAKPKQKDKNSTYN